MMAGVLNGVDVQKVIGIINDVKQNPQMGNYHFHIRNQWMVCGHNRSIIDSFNAAGEEIPHAQSFTLDADEPAELAGSDLAPSPVEHQLHALAACVTSSMVYHAAARGIEIEELESELEGDIDLRGFLGLSEDVRKGFSNIRINFRIKTDAEEIEDFETFCNFSPVLDVTRNGTNVDITVERM